MSWLDRIRDNITIETGDGQTYRPEWINAVYEQEFNLKGFNFPDVPGTLIKRRQPRGRQFALEVYFQGNDHIEEAEQFRRSAENTRFWKIQHPYYDQINVQPRNLRVDNRKHNISKITSLILETITQVLPTGGVSPVDEIEFQKVELDAMTAQNFADQTSDLQPTEVTQISSDVEVIESNANDIIEDSDEKVNFRNAIINAQRAIVSITAEPLQAMQAIQGAINLPFQVAATVEARVNSIINQFNRIVESLGNITGLSRNERVYLQSQGSNMVSAAAVASITNLDEFPYNSQSDVDNIYSNLVDFYNNYIELLDEAQTDSQTQEDSFAADPDVITGVQDIVFFTLSRLDEIALGSEREFTVVNEHDSNAIVLTHRFYGLDDQDANLQRFINTNQIGLKEILNVPKDRELIYYR